MRRDTLYDIDSEPIPLRKRILRRERGLLAWRVCVCSRLSRVTYPGGFIPTIAANCNEIFPPQGNRRQQQQVRENGSERERERGLEHEDGKFPNSSPESREGREGRETRFKFLRHIIIAAGAAGGRPLHANGGWASEPGLRWANLSVHDRRT